MKTTLTDNFLKSINTELESANRFIADTYPGERIERQPVHTVYGGAQLFKSDTAVKIGSVALKNFNQFAPDAETFASALGLETSAGLNQMVYERVRAKLEREAVEDFRIDFEDGFGNRPDEEEDQTAVQAAKAVAEGHSKNTLPPFLGIRIKSFCDETKNRGIRTTDLFLTTLLDQTKGKLPQPFYITLPKVTHPKHVQALVQILDKIEENYKLPKHALQIELMIELTQTILDRNGAVVIPELVRAADGRCAAAHFGTYDYTASCSITAQHQAMDHPACDFAKHMMQVSLGGTGVWLSDGATNVMPVGDEKTVHDAWRLAYQHIRHSLRMGFYQGWDLHPAQIPIRYAACYAFFLEGLESVSIRLKNFVDKATQATLVGDVFDDAATGQGLLNYFLRGISCGAITEKEAEATGLQLSEIRGRSFKKIMENRRKN